MATAYEAVTEALLRAMTDEIVRTVRPLRVLLFGSHARGDARADSDVDLLVIEDLPFGPGRSRVDEAGRLWQALARFFVPKDTLVFTDEEVRRWAAARNHVIARALREGRVLYERT
jgi:predicted nucleotidyltransferase